MSYHLSTRWGESIAQASISQMRQALAELSVQDQEHPDASLIHESEWCLSVFSSGLVIWENVEEADFEPKHMKESDQEKILDLWIKLSEGQINLIHQEDWQDGYGGD